MNLCYVWDHSDISVSSYVWKYVSKWFCKWVCKYVSKFVKNEQLLGFTYYVIVNSHL